MYDRAETAAANDRLWALIAQDLPDAPPALDRDQPLWDIWQSPELLLAQTCGLPFRARLSGQVTLVGTPDYGLPGCPPGYYNSVLISRRGDSADFTTQARRRVAVNDGLSQSGWAALADHAAVAKVALGPRVMTGSHVASARAVAQGSADIAAIDAVTWALIRRHDRFAADLQELARTTPTPGLPLITAQAARAPQLFTAVQSAIAALDPADRDTLHLRGLVAIPASAYLALPLPPEC